MSFWGGLNSNQLLDLIDYDLIKKNPKVFIGYSDSTVLNLAIQKKSGLITYTGPSFISFTKPSFFSYTWEYFYKACFQNKRYEALPSPNYSDDAYYKKPGQPREIQENAQWKVFKEGNASGTSYGVHLYGLIALIGTEYIPNLENVVLFLEEADEFNFEMIDRGLMQLKHAKILDKLAGVVWGRFMPQSGFDKFPTYFEDLLRRIFSEYNYPIIYDVDFGHTDPILTVPNGGECVLSAKNERIKLEFLPSTV